MSRCLYAQVLAVYSECLLFLHQYGTYLPSTYLPTAVSRLAQRSVPPVSATYHLPNVPMDVTVTNYYMSNVNIPQLLLSL